jgi:hypothetical protein
MDALFQFFSAVAVAVTAMSFSHFGVAAEGLEVRNSPPSAERSVKRSRAPAPTVERIGR